MFLEKDGRWGTIIRTKNPDNRELGLGEREREEWETGVAPVIIRSRADVDGRGLRLHPSP